MVRQSNKRISKNDLFLISALLLIGVISLFFVRFFQKESGDKVTVTIDGTLFGTYELSEEQTIAIPIDGETGNLLFISDGQVDMIDATCPDKLCVHQKSISRQGEAIVCLPHKVVVEVHTGKQAEFDSISK